MNNRNKNGNEKRSCLVAVMLLLLTGTGTVQAAPPKQAEAPKTERTRALAEARETYEAERQRLRIAVAKLSEPALKRCLEIGRLTGWLDAVDAERKLRGQELARLHRQPGPDAFELAVECRTRLRQLEESRRQILVKISRLEREHLHELVREGRTKLRLAPSSLMNRLPADLKPSELKPTDRKPASPKP